MNHLLFSLSLTLACSAFAVATPSLHIHCQLDSPEKYRQAFLDLGYEIKGFAISLRDKDAILKVERESEGQRLEPLVHKSLGEVEDDQLFVGLEPLNSGDIPGIVPVEGDTIFGMNYAKLTKTVSGYQGEVRLEDEYSFEVTCRPGP